MTLLSSLKFATIKFCAPIRVLIGGLMFHVTFCFCSQAIDISTPAPSLVSIFMAPYFLLSNLFKEIIFPRLCLWGRFHTAFLTNIVNPTQKSNYPQKSCGKPGLQGCFLYDEPVAKVKIMCNQLRPFLSITLRIRVL